MIVYWCSGYFKNPTFRMDHLSQIDFFRKNKILSFRGNHATTAYNNSQTPAGDTHKQGYTSYQPEL